MSSSVMYAHSTHSTDVLNGYIDVIVYVYVYVCHMYHWFVWGKKCIIEKSTYHKDDTRIIDERVLYHY